MSANKDIKLTTRVSPDEYAKLKMICREAEISSPYKIVQVLVHWLIGTWEEHRTADKESLGDPIAMEIQEAFDGFAEGFSPRGKAFTTDRRNG